MKEVFEGSLKFHDDAEMGSYVRVAEVMHPSLNFGVDFYSFGEPPEATADLEGRAVRITVETL